MPVGRPKPKPPHPLVELLRAELQPDHHGADVRRLGKDPRNRLGSPAPVVCLTHGPVRDRDLRRHLQRRAGLHELLLEGARDRECLEGRARLVVRLDRAVLARVGGRSVHVVGIDARPVREREDLARARIHHHRRGAERRVGLADVGQHRLGALLDACVERERQILAGLGALRLDHADRLAERVLHEPPLAVLAAQRIVLRILQPGQPRVVGADQAEHLRGQEALRVGALRLGHRADALDPELLHLVTARGVHLALEVDEPGLLVGELAQQLVLGPLEKRRQLRGHLHRVLDQERICEDSHGILRDGQLHVVAIDDRAATRRIGHVLDLLADRAL